MIVTGYGNEPGREKSVADDDVDVEGAAEPGPLLLLDVGGIRGMRPNAAFAGWVQIRTRNRVWAHVQRTRAAALVEPPSRSSGTSAASEALRGWADLRKIERS